MVQTCNYDFSMYYRGLDAAGEEEQGIASYLGRTAYYSVDT